MMTEKYLGILSVVVVFVLHSFYRFHYVLLDRNGHAIQQTQDDVISVKQNHPVTLKGDETIEGIIANTEYSSNPVIVGITTETASMETEKPVRRIRTNEPTELVKTDEPTKQVRTAEPTEPMKTDEQTEPMKTDEPTKQVRTVEPIEPLLKDEPAKSVKADIEIDPNEDKGSYKHWIHKIPRLTTNESLDFVDEIVLQSWYEKPSLGSELLPGPYQVNETLVAATRDYLRIREQGQLLSLGKKLLNREALQVYMVGGSNTDGRVAQPFFDRFIRILNNRFSPREGKHKLTRSARGGASSCYYATHFKMSIQNKLSASPADLIFLEFQVNDFSEELNCLEVLMIRCLKIAPQATIVALGLMGNTHHDATLDFHLVPQVDMGPLMDRANDILYPRLDVENKKQYCKKRGKRCREKLVLTDNVHIGSLGTIITVHAMVALLVEAMAIARDSTQTGIVPSDPRWDEQQSDKNVSNYDLLLEPRYGATVLVEDVAAIVASCSDLLEASESHGATDLSACREHVLSVAMNSGWPQKNQLAGDNLYCDAEAFATGAMEGSFASRGKSREQCLDEIHNKANVHHFSFKQLGWGWTQCFSPHRATCRPNGVNNEHCSNSGDNQTGMFKVHYQKKQMERSNKFTKATISLDVLKGYDQNFGRVIAIAWRNVWVNGTQVVTATDPVLLDSLWDRPYTVGEVVQLDPPLQVSGTEKQFDFSVALFPLNEKVIRKHPCRFHLSEVIVAFAD